MNGEKNNKRYHSVDFIGIGTQRSATTWIHACLSEHPEICMPTPRKETHYLHDTAATLSGYMKYFSHCKAGAHIGEFTPNYLYSDTVRSHIADWFPSVKLIISLRNPIDRAVSRYKYKISTGKNDGKTFEETIEKDKEGYLDQGCYMRYINKYLEHFDRNNILVIVYDDIENNPAKVIENLYRFLEVNPGFMPSALKSKINISAKNRFRSPTINKLIERASFWLRSIHVGRSKTGTYVLRVLDRIRMLNKTSSAAQIPADKMPIKKETLVHLHDYFRKDTESLEKFLNRNLGW